METIKEYIIDYLECIGVDYSRVHIITESDADIIVIVTNNGYITTDATEVIFSGMENVLKKHGVDVDG